MSGVTILKTAITEPTCQPPTEFGGLLGRPRFGRTLAATPQLGPPGVRSRCLPNDGCEAIPTTPTVLTVIGKLYKGSPHSFLHTLKQKNCIFLSRLVQCSSAKWSRIEQFSESSTHRKISGMTLVAFLSSFVRLSELIEYSSLYTFGTLLYLSIGFHLYLCPYSCVTSLLERCSGVGLMFMRMIALYYSRGYRVVFDNVSMVFRLLDLIYQAYMLRDSRGGPLMVTTQYGYSSMLVYIPKTLSWGGYSSAFSPGWTAMIGCRNKLGNPGWSLETPEAHCQGNWLHNCILANVN